MVPALYAGTKKGFVRCCNGHESGTDVKEVPPQQRRQQWWRGWQWRWRKSERLSPRAARQLPASLGLRCLQPPLADLGLRMCALARVRRGGRGRCRAWSGSTSGSSASRRSAHSRRRSARASVRARHAAAAQCDGCPTCRLSRRFALPPASLHPQACTLCTRLRLRCCVSLRLCPAIRPPLPAAGRCVGASLLFCSRPYGSAYRGVARTSPPPLRP